MSYTRDIESTKSLIRIVWQGALAFIAMLISPIHDFIIAILILATLNMVFGLAQDHFHFNFKKAFKSFWYLAGYLFLLLLSVLVSELMRIKETEITEIVSWVTWLMIWFYATNIFKNWEEMQPDNDVISIIYHVLSFKMVERLQGTPAGDCLSESAYRNYRCGIYNCKKIISINSRFSQPSKPEKSGFFHLYPLS